VRGGRGKDSAHIILIFPTGNPNAEEALDRAIEKKKGRVALKNASIYSSWFYIPYIWPFYYHSEGRGSY
jgi:hypothetical protein